MKLYIPSRINNQKICIDSIAQIRNDLRIQFGGDRFMCDGYEYDVSEVWAEPEFIKLAGPVAALSILGVLAGPLGIIIGLGVGGALGSKQAVKDRDMANVFNNTH